MSPRDIAPPARATAPLPYRDPAGTGGADGLQRAFVEALLDPDRAVPPGLVGPDGQPSARRFAIYRNNVVAGLAEALGQAYPAVRRLVGDAFFSAMAQIYVRHHPPRTPVILDYGASFPGFVRTFGPAASLPYLADVACLERAWIEAYHAADARPLAPGLFRQVAPAQLPRLVLVLHPSVRTVRSAYPITRIWQMNIDGGVPGPVDLDGGGEDALVSRPDAAVEVRVLPAAAGVFIAALASGATLLAATGAALDSDPRFDAAGALTGLLSGGAVTGWHLADAAPDETRDTTCQPHSCA